MSSGSHRRRQPGQWTGETVALWAGLGALAVVCAVVQVSVWGGWKLAGRRKAPPLNPVDTTFGLLNGTVKWVPESTTVAAAASAVVLLGAAVAVVLLVRRRRRRSRVDDAARWLGRHREITPITTAHASATSSRLGVDTPGVRIGTAVATGKPVWGTWEDMHIDIWGPRTGKTTSRAIPAILEAPGAVLVTSNKRDVVDATWGVRRAVGEVWVFDPQNLAGESPDWWWDPLSYVTDEVKAARLAEHFAAGSRAPGARTDAFFDPAGQDVLAALLLAAAVDGRPITDVYRWLTRPTDDTAVDLLNAAGYPLTADQLAGHIAAPDRQRGGVFGTAAQMASCLTNRQAAAWVTPAGPLDPRPHFDPAEFIEHRDSLYLLSKEGRGSTGPLTTALTVAVIEAAEDHARTCPGGRLPVPLLGVLDEAANVCRWQDLPDLYSHFGSRGIVLMTILQSWSQGVQVWGEAGMRKLWSAANIAVYGGGVKENDFLDMLSRLIGDHDKHTRSVSTGRGQRSVTAQLSRERILDPADLAALPPGRAVVLASGARPTLIQTQPWMTGPHAGAVRASLQAHGPGTRP